MIWHGGITLFPNSVFVNKTAKDKTAGLFQDSQGSIIERAHLKRITTMKVADSGCSSSPEAQPQRGADWPLLKSYDNQSGLDATPGWHTEHLPLKMNCVLAKQALGINPVHTWIHSLSRGYQPARSAHLDRLRKPHHSCSQVTLPSVGCQHLLQRTVQTSPDCYGKSTVNVHNISGSKIRSGRLPLTVCPFLLFSRCNLCGTNIINRYIYKMDMNLSQQIKTFLSKIHENEVGIQNDCRKALEIGDLFGKYKFK